MDLPSSQQEQQQQKGFIGNVINTVTHPVESVFGGKQEASEQVDAAKASAKEKGGQAAGAAQHAVDKASAAAGETEEAAQGLLSRGFNAAVGAVNAGEGHNSHSTGCTSPLEHPPCLTSCGMC